MLSRILVVVVSAAYLGFAYHDGEARVAVATVLFLVFPVAMIWFADDLAPTTGLFIDQHRVTGPSSPFLVKLFGFAILLTPPAVALWYR